MTLRQSSPGPLLRRLGRRREWRGRGAPMKERPIALGRRPPRFASRLFAALRLAQARFLKHKLGITRHDPHEHAVDADQRAAGVRRLGPVVVDLDHQADAGHGKVLMDQRIGDDGERTNPSVERNGRRITARRIKVVSIARLEKRRCPPGVVRHAARQPAIASSESQTRMSPRRTRPRSYSARFRTRYRALGMR